MNGSDESGTNGPDESGTNGPDERDLEVPKDLTISLIAAVAENGVIGDSGGMPWHHPADLRRFKETTTGHPVILGRRTHESIVADLGEPLPDRTSIVLSRSDLDLAEGAVQAGSVDEALDRAADAAEELDVDVVYVAGGATVYEAFLPIADELLITEIHETHAGDTTFPSWDRGEWELLDREDREELSFLRYRRRSQ